MFYIVGSNSILVINPAMSSTSILYSQIYFSDPIQSIDAVNIIDKEILFIRTKLNLTAYVFAQEPKLYIDWT